MFIIWGSKGREVELSSGAFYCPYCRQNTPYQHVRLSRYFTLYFIPLFPIENLGEVVRCEQCRQAYNPSILDHQTAMPDDAALRAVRQQLDGGLSVEAVRRRLEDDGATAETTEYIVGLAAGDRPSTCGGCDLTFAESVTRCPECGKKL